MSKYQIEKEKLKHFSHKDENYSSYVLKCIICGEPASEYGGHVHFEDSESFLVAGFCNDCTKEKRQYVEIQTQPLKKCHLKNGCFGNINNNGLIKYKEEIINFK